MTNRGLLANRREFLKTAAAAVAVPYLISSVRPWAPTTGRRPASGSSWAASAWATWAAATRGPSWAARTCSTWPSAT